MTRVREAAGGSRLTGSFVEPARPGTRRPETSSLLDTVLVHA